MIAFFCCCFKKIKRNSRLGSVRFNRVICHFDWNVQPIHCHQFTMSFDWNMRWMFSLWLIFGMPSICECVSIFRLFDDALLCIGAASQPQFHSFFPLLYICMVIKWATIRKRREGRMKSEHIHSNQKYSMLRAHSYLRMSIQVFSLSFTSDGTIWLTLEWWYRSLTFDLFILLSNTRLLAIRLPFAQM